MVLKCNILEQLTQYILQAALASKVILHPNK